MIGRLVPLLLLATVGGCIARRVTVAEVERSTDSVQVRAPVKAHMVDGSTVFYPAGVLVAGERPSLGYPTPAARARD